MTKYCKFLRDVYDGKELIFKKNKEYLITYEDKEQYNFEEYEYKGKIIKDGILKIFKNKLYTVIEKEE